MKKIFRNILVPLDMSKHSIDTLKYSLDLADLCDARLYVIHVVEFSYTEHVYALEISGDVSNPAVVEAALVRKREDELNTFVKKNCPPGRKKIEIEKLTIPGDPIEKIIEISYKKKIDLIVLGSHGKTGLSNVLLGSVAEKIIKNAPCPVLTVRELKSGGVKLKEVKGKAG